MEAPLFCSHPCVLFWAPFIFLVQMCPRDVCVLLSPSLVDGYSLKLSLWNKVSAGELPWFSGLGENLVLVMVVGRNHGCLKLFCLD